MIYGLGYVGLQCENTYMCIEIISDDICFKLLWVINYFRIEIKDFKSYSQIDLQSSKNTLQWNYYFLRTQKRRRRMSVSSIINKKK